MAVGRTSEKNWHLTRREVALPAFAVTFLLTLWMPLQKLSALATQSEQYSHIPFIPLVSIYLLFRSREKISRQAAYQPGLGATVVLAGGGLLWLAHGFASALSKNDTLSLTAVGLITIALGGFLGLYGTRAFRAVLFPVLFLYLITPIPDAVLQIVIWLLQMASAEAVGWFYGLAGIPTFRDGMVFTLPGLNIEVAKECSGIRSSLALFITGLLAGYFYLRSPWRKGVLLVAVFPITVLKNGLRIFALSSLAVYQDPAWMTGWLHTQGGVVFFGLGLLVLAGILWQLRRMETMATGRQASTELA